MAESTVTLADFLLARIAEDEAVAQAQFDDVEEEWGNPYATGAGIVFRDRFDPARVLAECGSRRRIVGRHNLWHVCPNVDGSGDTDYSPGDGDIGMRPCPTMLDLAAVYSSHPDYREEWRRDA